MVSDLIHGQKYLINCFQYVRNYDPSILPRHEAHLLRGGLSMNRISNQIVPYFIFLLLLSFNICVDYGRDALKISKNVQNYLSKHRLLSIRSTLD